MIHRVKEHIKFSLIRAQHVLYLRPIFHIKTTLLNTPSSMLLKQKLESLKYQSKPEFTDRVLLAKYTNNRYPQVVIELHI